MKAESRQIPQKLAARLEFFTVVVVVSLFWATTAMALQMHMQSLETFGFHAHYCKMSNAAHASPVLAL